MKIIPSHSQKSICFLLRSVSLKVASIADSLHFKLSILTNEHFGHFDLRNPSKGADFVNPKKKKSQLNSMKRVQKAKASLVYLKFNS